MLYKNLDMCLFIVDQLFKPSFNKVVKWNPRSAQIFTLNLAFGNSLYNIFEVLRSIAWVTQGWLAECALSRLYIVRITNDAIKGFLSHI